MLIDLNFAVLFITFIFKGLHTIYEVLKINSHNGGEISELKRLCPVFYDTEFIFGPELLLRDASSLSGVRFKNRKYILCKQFLYTLRS